MRFRRRVVLAFTSLVLVVVLTAASAVVVIRVVRHSNHELSEAADDLSLVHEARLQAEQLVSVGRGYLLSGSTDARQRLDRLDARFDKTRRALERRASGRKQRAFTELGRIADDYVASIRRAAKRRIATGGPAAIVDVFEHQIKPLRIQFEAAAEAFVQGEQRRARSSESSARSLAGTAEIALFALLAVALTLAFALAWSVARKLVAQYQDAEGAKESARRAAAARDELLAVVSHDLRAPLGTIVLGTALLAESASSNHQRAARSISNAAERMRHLIDDLLAREQLQAGTLLLELDTHEARELVAAALDLYRDKASLGGIDLTSDVAATPVTADRERLLQILLNLIGNAVKFTRPGGAVTARVYPTPGASRFEVTDSGPGIAADQLPHLFDRYFQGERRGRGSVGLGLYICKRLVEAHGGSIGVDSAPNRGTTVWFTIPTRDARHPSGPAPVGLFTNDLAAHPRER